MKSQHRSIAVALPDGGIVMYPNATGYVVVDDSLRLGLVFDPGNWSAVGHVDVEEFVADAVAEGMGWEVVEPKYGDRS